MRKQQKAFILITLAALLTMLAGSCEEEGDDEKDNANIQFVSEFTDSRDGTMYKAVKIGEQIWMAENLKYLPSIVGPATGSKDVPYYYVYGYDGNHIIEAKKTANYETYGVLYNWSAAMAGYEPSATNPSGVKGICPDGWHLPSLWEWEELTDYLGDSAACKLKAMGTIEAGTGLWYEPNTEATNVTGFTALPGGYRTKDGRFTGYGKYGNFWSCTHTFTVEDYGYYRLMIYDRIEAQRKANPIQIGQYVRCLKDLPE